MSMFTDYDNQPDNYVPNNIRDVLCPPRLFLTDGLPIEEQNVLGKFIGYTWHYGDTFDFIIPIQEKVKVEDNAIVYTVTEETPTENTQGEIGQMAYNTVDLLCWKCRGLFDDIYIWDKQDQFTYPENGTKEVTLIVHKDISGNKVKVNIYNFRMEKVMDRWFEGEDSITLSLSEEDYKILVPDIYTFEIVIYNEDTKYYNNANRFTVQIEG